MFVLNVISTHFIFALQWLIITFRFMNRSGTRGFFFQGTCMEPHWQSKVWSKMVAEDGSCKSLVPVVIYTKFSGEGGVGEETL